MRLKSLLAGVAGALLLSSAAMAADPVVMAVPPPPPPPPPPAPSFDWDGWYVGGTFYPIFGGAAQIGHNFTFGNALFGLEVEGGFGVAPGPALFGVAGAKAKLGAVLGAEDRLVLYGDVGLLKFIPSPFTLAYVGGGVEIGFRNRPVSWFAEADAAFILGVGPPGPPGLILQTGINFHFR